MAFGGYFCSLCVSILLSPSLGRAAGQELTVVQPQDIVKVRAGSTLSLGCSVLGKVPPGPVKWYLGEGRARKLIYAEIGLFERVLRTKKYSDTDFSIAIRNVTPEDAGTYYCVKQKKDLGDDIDVKTGPGTRVVVKDARDVFTITAVAVAAGLLLAGSLFTVAYVWAKKRRARSRAGNSRSEDALPVSGAATNQISTDKEIVYADLKEPRVSQRPKQSSKEEHSEYATIQVALSSLDKDGKEASLP